MNIKNGIAVNFTYSEAERKKYRAAGKALNDYKADEHIKEASKDVISYRKESRMRTFWKSILLIFFMCYEMIFVIKKNDMYVIQSFAEVGWICKLAELSDVLVLTFTIVLFILIIYFIKSRNNVLGYSFGRVLWEFVKYFFKAAIAWVIVLSLIYIIGRLVPENTSIYKMINVESNKKDEEIYIAENEDAEIYENTLWEENEVYEKKLEHSEVDYTDCFFEIVVDVANIYVDPTDGSHMYTALMNSTFIATGEVYIDVQGIRWYEFYINSEKSAKAWVRESDINFL